MTENHQHNHFFDDLIDDLLRPIKSEFSVLKKTFLTVKTLIKIMPEEKKTARDISDDLQNAQSELNRLQTQLNKDKQSLHDDLSAVKYPFHKK